MNNEEKAKHLTETGWTLTERKQWYKPNWKPLYESRQKERLEGTGIPTGHYTTLQKAYRIQLGFDSAPEVEGLEESLEDMMLMSSADEFGA